MSDIYQAMTMYVTHDVAASIRKAHDKFTHVLVNRSYETLRKAYFKSDRIRDLLIFKLKRDGGLPDLIARCIL